MKNIYTFLSHISHTTYNTIQKNYYFLQKACLSILGILIFCSTLCLFSSETTPYTTLSSVHASDLHTFWMPLFDQTKKITCSKNTYIDSETNKEKLELHICIEESLTTIASLSCIASPHSSILELAGLWINKSHRNQYLGSKLIQGLAACATTYNFNALEFQAVCIDTSVKDTTQRELELAQRYFSVLKF